jgi:hypothetical protein
MWSHRRLTRTAALTPQEEAAPKGAAHWRRMIRGTTAEGKSRSPSERNTGFSVPTPKPCDRRLCAGIRRLQRRRLWTAGAMLPLSKRRHSRRTPKLQALTTLRAPTRFAHALLLPKTVLLARQGGFMGGRQAHMDTTISVWSARGECKTAATGFRATAWGLAKHHHNAPRGDNPFKPPRE